jgi:hypothetical protein
LKLKGQNMINGVGGGGESVERIDVLTRWEKGENK